jgi:hypothetical protein
VESDAGCDAELAELKLGLVCPFVEDEGSDAGCDAEVAGLDTGLACLVGRDVESDSGCDAEDAELTIDVTVPVVSIVPLGMIVTLEDEDENV